MEPLPCKDCICLPVCKALYMKYTEGNIAPPYSATVRAKIQAKCSILNSYMYDNDDNKINVNRTIEFHDFMKFGVCHEKIITM